MDLDIPALEVHAASGIGNKAFYEVAQLHTARPYQDTQCRNDKIVLWNNDVIREGLDCGAENDRQIAMSASWEMSFGDHAGGAFAG